MVIDHGCDTISGGGEDGGIKEIILRKVGVDQVEQILHAAEPNVILVRL